MEIATQTIFTIKTSDASITFLAPEAEAMEVISLLTISGRCVKDGQFKQSANGNRVFIEQPLPEFIIQQREVALKPLEPSEKEGE